MHRDCPGQGFSAGYRVIRLESVFQPIVVAAAIVDDLSQPTQVLGAQRSYPAIVRDKNNGGVSMSFPAAKLNPEKLLNRRCAGSCARNYQRKLSLGSDWRKPCLLTEDFRCTCICAPLRRTARHRSERRIWLCDGSTSNIPRVCLGCPLIIRF